MKVKAPVCVCVSPWTLRSESLIPNEEDAFRQIRSRHQFFEILRIMAHPAFNGRMHDQMLGDCLEPFALGGSGAQIRNALIRLEELGLVRCSKVEAYVLAELTEKGERVAFGKDRMDEVARPPLPGS